MSEKEHDCFIDCRHACLGRCGAKVYDEPVAWKIEYLEGGVSVIRDWVDAANAKHDGLVVTPLYLRPKT